MMTEGSEIMFSSDEIMQLTQIMQSQLMPINQRLDAMDRRFDGIDLRLDSMDRRFDGIDLRLDSIEERLDDLTESMEEVRGATNHLLAWAERISPSFRTCISIS